MSERAVWKFTLRPYACFTSMPVGSRLLTAAAQGDDLCVWAEVTPDAPEVTRAITVVPTGAQLDRAAHDWKYLATAFMGDMVFHVYDGGEQTATPWSCAKCGNGSVNRDNRCSLCGFIAREALDPASTPMGGDDA